MVARVAGVRGAKMAAKGPVTSTVASAETVKLQPGNVVGTAAVVMAEMVAMGSLETDHRALRLSGAELDGPLWGKGRHQSQDRNTDQAKDSARSKTRAIHSAY